MQHKGYNDVVTSTNIGQKIKYQGQERQDELGLNWDSFKYRNYDYAIGRFMSVDPLAEKYVYNGVYNFQENKMGMGRELEGLELTQAGTHLQNETNKVVAQTKQVLTSALNSTANFFSSIGDAISGLESKAGGYDFRSDLKTGSDSDSQQKRKGDKNTEIKDVTGFDAASGLSSGKTNNQTKKNC
jgi:RHS repeat-associated protein